LLKTPIPPEKYRNNCNYLIISMASNSTFWGNGMGFKKMGRSLDFADLALPTSLEQRGNEMRKFEFHRKEYFPLIPQSQQPDISRTYEMIWDTIINN